MKKLFTSFLLVTSLVIGRHDAHAQLRIGTSSTPINPGASLDVVGQPTGTTTYQGLLLPRVVLTNYATWSLAGSPVDGMLVFNTATTTGDFSVSPGIYCWYNVQWNRQLSVINPAIITSVDCQQSTAATGTYYPSVALSASNTKQIRITPSSAGPFSATTNVVNGYSFSASGVFTAAQIGVSQLITLQGIGTPQVAGTNTFNLTVGTQTCTFNVTVLGGLDCSGPLAGTYQANVPLTSANTKQITYVPATAGPYSVSTNVVNGYSFAASGTFTAAQVGVTQTITLQASGTPQTKSPNLPDTFTLAIGSQTCSFDVNPLPPYDCSGPLTGTYKLDTPLNNTNTKQITYVPNVAGDHTFLFLVYQYDVLAEPFSLSKTVTFTAAQIGTPQTITLVGSGTPKKTGTFPSSLQIFIPGSSNTLLGCSINITVVP
ncbi:hypothetical protein GCM10028807_39290 [Spirosoma daeguense]